MYVFIVNTVCIVLHGPTSEKDASLHIKFTQYTYKNYHPLTYTMPFAIQPILSLGITNLILHLLPPTIGPRTFVYHKIQSYNHYKSTLLSLRFPYIPNTICFYTSPFSPKFGPPIPLYYEHHCFRGLTWGQACTRVFILIICPRIFVLSSY